MKEKGLFILNKYLLAEFLGTMIGDGNMFYKKRPNSVFYKITLSGDAKEDRLYYKCHIQKIFEALFFIKLKCYFSKKNEISLYVYSKEIFNLLKFYGLPIGNKNNAKTIPECIIFGNSDIKCDFLRGLFDADGSITFKSKHKKLHYYPVITISFRNEAFIRNVASLLKELNFSFYVEYNEDRFDIRTNKWYSRSSIYISGKRNLKKWMGLIGFSNPKHFTKIRVWQKYGFCPPKTTLNQRMNIILRRLDPFSFYN